MPVLSVVIPTYNMGPWLSVALESCLWQSHRDLEILVIDDGSLDNSAAIAKAYAGIDSRIRVIEQQNAGAGAARQRGQDEASGDYITWLDADDFMAPGAAAVWLELAVKDGADLVCGNALAFSDRTFNSRRYFYHPPARGLLFDDAPRYWKSKVLWRWVFSLPLIRDAGLAHTGFKLGQDACYMFEALLRAGSFSQAGPIVYYFRQEHKSAQASLETRVEHGFVHFLEVRRILLNPPDGRPRLKPFIKYLNENYWRDIQKTAPLLVGGEKAREDRIIALGQELCDGLDLDWFSNRALAPEVRERKDFLPFAEALIRKDAGKARQVLAAIRSRNVVAPDKRNSAHALRHTIKAVLNPLSWSARLLLRRLEGRARQRAGVPKPEYGPSRRTFIR